MLLVSESGVLHLIYIRKIVFASELELISLTLCSRPLLSVSNPFSRLKPKLMTGAKEQNCRVAHEVPSKSMGIMLCLAIITRAFCSFMPCLKSQLADRYPTYLKIWDHQGNMPDINQFKKVWISCTLIFDRWHVPPLTLYCASPQLSGAAAGWPHDMNGGTRWHHYASSTGDWRQKHHLARLASGATGALKEQAIQHPDERQAIKSFVVQLANQVVQKDLAEMVFNFVDKKHLGGF